MIVPCGVGESFSGFGSSPSGETIMKKEECIVALRPGCTRALILGLIFRSPRHGGAHESRKKAGHPPILGAEGNMKQTEQATVTLNMVLFQAERIETAFGRIGDIASALRNVINEARRKDAQSNVKAPDDVLIPVTVKLTFEQARTILRKYKEWLDAPTDRDIYVLVNKAINEGETA